ncbi:MAG: MFS transporter [Chloroflexota bacterium]
MTHSSSQKWLVLSLCVLTITVVYTVPTLMLPVLFGEISAELDLSVVQLGVAWGSLSLSSIFVGVFGGAIGDRIGSKRMLTIACLLTGLLGALRGLAPNYGLLVATFLLYGFVAPSLPPNIHKTGAYFFPARRGIATGTISFGFALALFLGSRYTATVFSPLVGGWRNVLFWFAGAAVLFAILWHLLVPDGVLPPPQASERPFFQSVFKSLRHVLKVRELWIIGIATILFWACFRGFAGYTPIYLRNAGWTPVAADGALSGFFGASLVLAIPLVILSERATSRKPFLIAAMLTAGVGILMLGLGSESLVVAGLIVSGLMFDAFMGIYQAEILDLPGVGTFAGSALGVAMTFREIGGAFGPTIGNWLAQFGSNIPFIFWGVLALLAAGVFLRLPTRRRSAKST